jgi:hypothetical protein
MKKRKNDCTIQWLNYRTMKKRNKEIKKERKKERMKEWKNEWKMERMNAWMTNNDWIITMIKWRYNEEKKECMHNWMIKL